MSAIAEIRTESLFVGNLPWKTDEQALKELFETIGPMRRANVPRDVTRRDLSRGFGFVEMVSKEDARRARAELDKHSLGGRLINVEWARS